MDRLHQRGIGQGLFADPFQILRKRQRSDSLHRGIKEIVRPISDLGDRHSLHLLRDHQRGVGAGVAVRTGVVRIDEEGQRPLFRSSLRLPVPRIHVVVKGDSLALRVFFRRGAGIAVDQVFVNTGILDALREGGDRIRDHQVHPAVSGLVILRKTDVVGIEDAEDLLSEPSDPLRDEDHAACPDGRVQQGVPGEVHERPVLLREGFIFRIYRKDPRGNAVKSMGTDSLKRSADMDGLFFPVNKTAVEGPAAAAEGEHADLRKSVRQIRHPQLLTVEKRVIPDFFKTLREHDLLKGGVRRRSEGDLLRPLRDRDGSFKRCRNRQQLLPVRAVEEAVLQRDCRRSAFKADRMQLRIAVEQPLSGLLKARRQLRLRQRGVEGESVPPDLLHGIGEGKGGQAAGSKGVRSDRLQVLRKMYGCEVDAVVKCTVPDLSHRIRQGELLHRIIGSAHRDAVEGKGPAADDRDWHASRLGGHLDHRIRAVIAGDLRVVAVDLRRHLAPFGRDRLGTEGFLLIEKRHLRGVVFPAVVLQLHQHGEPVSDRRDRLRGEGKASVDGHGIPAAGAVLAPFLRRLQRPFRVPLRDPVVVDRKKGLPLAYVHLVLSVEVHAGILGVDGLDRELPALYVLLQQHRDVLLVGGHVLVGHFRRAHEPQVVETVDLAVRGLLHLGRGEIKIAPSGFRPDDLRVGRDMQDALSVRLDLHPLQIGRIIAVAHIEYHCVVGGRRVFQHILAQPEGILPLPGRELPYLPVPGLLGLPDPDDLVQHIPVIRGDRCVFRCRSAVLGAVAEGEIHGGAARVLHVGGLCDDHLLQSGKELLRMFRILIFQALREIPEVHQVIVEGAVRLAVLDRAEALDPAADLLEERILSLLQHVRHGAGQTGDAVHHVLDLREVCRSQRHVRIGGCRPGLLIVSAVGLHDPGHDLQRIRGGIQHRKTGVVPAVSRLQLLGSHVVLCVVRPEGHVFDRRHQAGVETHEIQLLFRKGARRQRVVHLVEQKRIRVEQLVAAVAPQRSGAVIP